MTETICGILIFACFALGIICLVLGIKLTAANGSKRYWEKECCDNRAAHRSAWDEIWERLMATQERAGSLERERDHLRARLTRTGTARTAAEKRVNEVLAELQQASTDRDAALAKLRHVHRASAEPTGAIPLGNLVEHIIRQTGHHSGKAQPNPPTEPCSNS